MQNAVLSLITFEHGLDFVAIAYVSVIALLHIIMALAVHGDATRNLKLHGGLFLLGPLVWGLLTLVFGLASFALYWVVHHSSLRATAPPHRRSAPDHTS